jgi:hypothetical protein
MAQAQKSVRESLPQFLMKSFGLKPERQMASPIITDFPRKSLKKEKFIWVEKEKIQHRRNWVALGIGLSDFNRQS